MNGISLLVVAATLGVNAQVELGPNNVATYTIRIESLVVEQLRQGQEVRTTVNAKDRMVRRFRVLVTPDNSTRKAPSRSASDFGAASQSLVEFEPVLLENDEIEMWVQISPERLETLAAGKSIEGEVADNVPGIDRYRIFVGVGQLPRQQAPGNGSDSSAPFLLTDSNAGLTPAAAQVPGSPDSSARIGAPPLRTSQFQGSSPSNTSGGTFGSNNNAGTFRGNDMRSAIRNQPDPTTMPPPTFDRFGQPTTGNSTFSNQPTAPSFSTGRDTYNNTRGADPYTQPSYSDRNAPLGYNNSANLAGQGIPGQGIAGQGGLPQNYSQNGYLQNSPVAQPHATLAARPDASTALPNSNATNWQQPVVSAPPITAPTTNATPPAVAPTAPPKSEEVVRSSTPLILTTLALFTSLGVNTYLGWLAWSFFWRYREAVNDSVRARSYNAPGRQAA